ncbi:hypothetical protein [Neorhodopirellula pilleata]|uniref:Uncharacterized protein n=1 Tax=Neorhodopirellula pilleata TaxID=2714738 RepID=A0A5C5ZQ29_9BACT|nr:hypothetical protein [Neorhodopirellula pilleata]TWT89579.1 hypothetical protein Pla100_55080 [Neorhodopirellula pilleata]
MGNHSPRLGYRGRSGEAHVLVLSRVATVLVIVIGTSPDDCAILRPRTTRRVSFIDRLHTRKQWLCTVIQAVLVTTKGNSNHDESAMKVMQYRIEAMPTRMAMKFDGVAESSAEYDVENAGIDYDNEHRVAEYEHETQNQRNARTMPCT